MTCQQSGAAPARQIRSAVAAPNQRLSAERASAAARLAVLDREFTSLVSSAGQANTDDEHDPEGPTLAFERQHAAALISQTRERIAEIDAALARLADGRYGRCELCGEPIGAERLAARPATRLCVICAGGRVFREAT